MAKWLLIALFIALVIYNLTHAGEIPLINWDK